MPTPTNKLYLTHPDLYNIDAADGAQVLEIDCDEKGNLIVIFDKTIFHPQGGGQVADKGTINGIKPFNVIKIGDPYGDFTVGHVFEEAVPFKVGDRVSMQIDADFRIYLCKLHTLGHLISNFAFILFELTYQKCQLDPDKDVTRLVFLLTEKIEADLNKLRKEPDKKSYKDKLALEINNAVNAEISRGSELTESRDEQGKRQVAIGSLFPFPCAGTHVHTLAELNGRSEINKINTYSESDMINGAKVKVKKLSIDFAIVAQKDVAKHVASEAGSADSSSVGAEAGAVSAALTQLTL